MQKLNSYDIDIDISNRSEAKVLEDTGLALGILLSTGMRDVPISKLGLVTYSD
jgi:hypothetical protein